MFLLPSRSPLRRRFLLPSVPCMLVGDEWCNVFTSFYRFFWTCQGQVLLESNWQQVMEARNFYFLVDRDSLVASFLLVSIQTGWNRVFLVRHVKRVTESTKIPSHVRVWTCRLKARCLVLIIDHISQVLIIIEHTHCLLSTSSFEWMISVCSMDIPCKLHSEQQ